MTTNYTIPQNQYLIKSERGWWLPKGYGYTQDLAQAGRFTLEDMAAFNLDGCTLYATQREQEN